MHRKQSAGAVRMAERRARESAAPTLAAENPTLASLVIEFVEFTSQSAPDVKYVRHVVVSSAPALFEVPCGDPSCSGGGHDITHEMSWNLRAKNTEFSGEHACYGGLGTAPCPRKLNFKAKATYQAEESGAR